MNTTYRAVVDRDGHGWRVRIQGVGGAAGVQALVLADVETRVRKLIWSYTGVNPVDLFLDVEVRLPPAIQVRLDLADHLWSEASLEIEAAVLEMLDAGVCVADVCQVIRQRCPSPRPFVVTNDEIAHHGLSRIPAAVGVWWDDRGRFLTFTCRSCVEAMRRTYLELPPDQESLLMYGRAHHCHCCNEPVDEALSEALS